MASLVKALQQAGIPLRVLSQRNSSYVMTVSRKWVWLFFKPAGRYYVKLEYDKDSGKLALVPFQLGEGQDSEILALSDPLVRSLYAQGGSHLVTVPKSWVRAHFEPIDGRYYVRVAHRPEDNALVLDPFRPKDYEGIVVTEKPRGGNGNDNSVGSESEE